MPKLDKRLLPNLSNLDPGAARETGVLDPGNQFGVDYIWLDSVGLGYDVTRIKARLTNAPVDSWRLIFDPKVVAKFQDCGVSVLDSPDDVVGAALAYLGKDPNSESIEDLEVGRASIARDTTLSALHGFHAIFGRSGERRHLPCVGRSGDVAQARQRAKEAGKGVAINYAIPTEGSFSIVDVLAIPADAPHPTNAHLFIDYLLRPDVAARNAMVVTYASGVADSVALVSEVLRNDSAVYPPPEVRARLVPMRAKSQESTRSLMRMWTRFKTGQ